ncbi:hypothetical protein V8C35DRAFT_108141 [Trichoderma chlorosporum]
MPVSSTCSVCIGSCLSHNDKEPRATTNCRTQAFPVPDDATYSMDRFLQHCNNKSDEDYLRPPPGLAEPQSEMESEERMRRLLCTFDENFGMRVGPSGS